MVQRRLKNIKTVEDFAKYESLWEHPALANEVKTGIMDGYIYHDFIRAVSLSKEPIPLAALEGISQKSNWEGDCAKKALRTRNLIFDDDGMLTIYLKRTGDMRRRGKLRDQFAKCADETHCTWLSSRQAYPSLFLLTRFYDELVDELEFFIRAQSSSGLGATKKNMKELMELCDRKTLAEYFQGLDLFPNGDCGPSSEEDIFAYAGEAAFRHLNPEISIHAWEGGRADGNKKALYSYFVKRKTEE